ncbi:MAG: hypothetical protein KAS02_02730 [Candidatus Pacebacteria bacterium]|nr:hypothetical protein [Candidatus Paceibacterota bacterium]
MERSPCKDCAAVWDRKMCSWRCPVLKEYQRALGEMEYINPGPIPILRNRDAKAPVWNYGRTPIVLLDSGGF